MVSNDNPQCLRLFLCSDFIINHLLSNGIVKGLFFNECLCDHQLLALLNQLVVSIFMLWLNMDENFVLFDFFLDLFSCWSFACPAKLAVNEYVKVIKFHFVVARMRDIHLSPEAFLWDVLLCKISSIDIVSIEVYLVFFDLHGNTSRLAFVIEDSLNDISIWESHCSNKPIPVTDVLNSSSENLILFVESDCVNSVSAWFTNVEDSLD